MKKKNSAHYTISDTPATSSPMLPLALHSDEHLAISTLESFSEQETADFSKIYLKECEDRLFG